MTQKNVDTVLLELYLIANVAGLRRSSMLGGIGLLGDRLLSLVVPKVNAEAGSCWWTTNGCGSSGQYSRNCCKPTGGSTCCGYCQ